MNGQNNQSSQPAQQPSRQSTIEEYGFKPTHEQESANSAVKKAYSAFNRVNPFVQQLDLGFNNSWDSGEPDIENVTESLTINWKTSNNETVISYEYNNHSEQFGYAAGASLVTRQNGRVINNFFSRRYPLV